MRHVDLSDNVLGAESFEVAVEFCKALAHNTSLVYANLDRNRLGQKAGMALAWALRKNRTMETLSVADNRFDADVGYALIRTIEKNHVLSSLHVREVEVGREVFAELQKRLGRRVTRTRGGQGDICRSAAATL